MNATKLKLNLNNHYHNGTTANQQRLHVKNISPEVSENQQQPQ